MKPLKNRRVTGDAASLALGLLVGQEKTFGSMAGRCSAAQAMALQEMRKERGYVRFGLTWREFCEKHMRISGSQADTIIRYLNEFGPGYFEHTQSVRIPPATYRLIAPFIHDKALLHGDEVLELNAANVQKVADEVRASRALPAPAVEAAAAEVVEEAPANPAEKLADLERSSRDIVTQFRDVAKDTRETPLVYSQFRTVLERMTADLQRVSLENGLV